MLHASDILDAVDSVLADVLDAVHDVANSNQGGIQTLTIQAFG